MEVVGGRGRPPGLALTDALRASAVLVVDDEPANVRMLERILRSAGLTRVTAATDACEAIARFHDDRPDLVLLDLHMPVVDGFAVLDRLAPALAADVYLPVLVLSGDASPAARHRALSSGARDFLLKPFDPLEVVLRVKNLLETRHLHLALDARVRERTLELEDSRREILHRLCRAAEYRDDDTGEHIKRVGRLAERIALELELPNEEAELIGAAAELHDVGKIGIPDSILLKPGKLTAEETAVMRQHTVIGAAMLAESRSLLLQRAEQIALAHHERWDGAGYPNCLAGTAIPLCARVTAVADFVDALTHDRPYRRAWSLRDTLEEVQRGASRHFDPDAARACLAVMTSSAAA